MFDSEAIWSSKYYSNGNIIAIGYPLELNDRTLLLDITEHEEIKYSSERFIPIGLLQGCCKVLCILPEEKKNLQFYSAISPASCNSYWFTKHTHMCNIGTDVMGISNYFLIGFEAHSVSMNSVAGSISRAKNL